MFDTQTIKSSHPMRRPCQCGSTAGRIEPKNGQDCVFCEDCGRWQYNAPKVETGREVRSVATVHNGISGRVRARILTRASGRCELCGARNNLHVGHILSVAAGMAAGLDEVLLNCPENLAALCQECNLGIGAEVIPLRLAVAIVLARATKEEVLL